MPDRPSPASTGEHRSNRSSVELLSVASVEMAGRPEAVPTIVVRAAVDLGLDGAVLRVLDPETLEHRVLEVGGVWRDSEEVEGVSAAMTDAVLDRGLTVLAGGVAARGSVPLPVSSDRVVAAVGCPVWVLGWISAVLIGIATGGTRISRPEVQAMELLAAHAGLTLASDRRIELERGVTQSIQEGDRLKNEFLTTISHEMRTPLTVLMGNGRTLENTWDALDDAGRRELLAAMNTNVAVLDRMVTDLLDYSRLEASELWVSFEPFEISSMLDRLSERVVTAGRRLATDIESDVLVSGDVVLIRRTVSNLIDNALAHTPEGTTVTVSCRRIGAEAEIAVADDGPGVPEEDLPYLGERFFRGGAATARPKGLGLGLALARGILELHDSALLVENLPGRGVRFSFSLPWVLDPARPDPVTGDPTRGPDAYAPPHDRA